MRLITLIRTLLVTGIFVALDQYLKASCAGLCVINQGSVFGLSIGNHVVLIMHILFLLIAWMIAKKQSPRLRQMVLLLAGFSTSNLIDRMLRGGVVDYLQVGGLNFNLADMAIDICLVIIVFLVFSNQRGSSQGK